MSVLAFTVLVFAGSLIAGLLGALTGLGGGVVLVPLLTLAFHVDLRYAISASLISVIATSSGAAAAYVREGYSNVRIGIFLEVATTLGALLGAFLAAKVPLRGLAILFGAVLIYSAWLSWHGDPEDAEPRENRARVSARPGQTTRPDWPGRCSSADPARRTAADRNSGCTSHLSGGRVSDGA
jgi:uncharacterized protein